MYNCNSMGIKPGEKQQILFKKYSINHLFDNSGEGGYNKSQILFSRKSYPYRRIMTHC